MRTFTVIAALAPPVSAPRFFADEYDANAAVAEGETYMTINAELAVHAGKN